MVKCLPVCGLLGLRARIAGCRGLSGQLSLAWSLAAGVRGLRRSTRLGCGGIGSGGWMGGEGGSARPGVSPGVRGEWAASNPSLGIRLNVSTVADEFAAMSPEMFIRERLGGWDENGAGTKAVQSEVWAARHGSSDQVELSSEGRRVVGVRFTPDGSTVAVAGAVRPDDESLPFVVEAIDQRSTSGGTQWLVDFLVERHKDLAQIVIDGKSGVGYLVNALRAEGVSAKTILTPTTDDVTAAHSMMEAAIRDGGLIHTGQEELDRKSVV